MQTFVGTLSHLAIYPQDVCMKMFIGSLFHVYHKGMVKKVWYIHSMEYYAAPKKTKYDLYVLN